MSKKFYRTNDYDMYDDYEYQSDYYQELQERRKNKRMRNAIRSKNIDDLMRDQDDDYGRYWYKYHMPIYTYHDPETDEQWDELWSYDTHKQFLSENPHLRQIFYAPAVISGVSGITHKNDSGFNDMMGRIAAANPTSPMAEKYGDKSVKASKTREAVKRQKLRQASR